MGALICSKDFKLVTYNFAKIKSYAEGQQHSRLSGSPVSWKIIDSESDVSDYLLVIWNIFYAQVCDDRRSSKEVVKPYLQYTLKKYEKLKPQLQLCLDEFKTYLKNAIYGDDFRINVSQIRRMATIIEVLYDRILPFFNTVKKHHQQKAPLPKLNELLQLLENSESAFVKGPLEKQLEQYYYIIQLEKASRGQLPYNALKKALFWKESRPEGNDADRLKIEAWARQLFKEKIEEKATFIHRGLRALTSQIGAIIPSEDCNWVDLSIELMHLQVPLNQIVEVSHCQWRSHLENKSSLLDKHKLRFNSNWQTIFKQSSIDLEIEGRFAESGYQFDKSQLYTLKNFPQLLLVTSFNRLDLLVRERLRQQHVSLIKTPDIVAIDFKGRFALVERLEPITDQKLVELLPDLFKRFIKARVCPFELKREYFLLKRIKKKEELYYAKGLLSSPFLYLLVMEELAYSCTLHLPNGLKNYQVLLKAIEKAPSYPACVAFFDQIVYDAAMGKKVDFACMHIEDGCIKERGKHLYTAVETLIVTIQLQLKQDYINRQEPAQLCQLLATVLVEEYRRTKAFGRLWPSLNADSIKQVLLGNKKAQLIKRVQ